MHPKEKGFLDWLNDALGGQVDQRAARSRPGLRRWRARRPYSLLGVTRSWASGGNRKSKMSPLTGHFRPQLLHSTNSSRLTSGLCPHEGHLKKLLGSVGIGNVCVAVPCRCARINTLGVSCQSPPVGCRQNPGRSGSTGTARLIGSLRKCETVSVLSTVKSSCSSQPRTVRG